MITHQLSAAVKWVASFCVAITAASVNGASADCLGYRRAVAVFHAKPTGAGTTADCKLQDSPDNSTFTDVASATFTQATTAGGESVQVMEIDLAKRQRYVRLVETGAGGSAAGAAVGEILLFRAQQEAPAQAATVVTV